MRGFDGTLPSRQKTGIGIVAQPRCRGRVWQENLLAGHCGLRRLTSFGRAAGIHCVVAKDAYVGHQAAAFNLVTRPRDASQAGHAGACPQRGRRRRVRACAQGVTRTQVLRSRLTAADRSSAFPRHIRKELPVWCRSRLDAGQACRLAADAPSDCRHGSPIVPVGTHADHRCHLAGEARRSARSEQAAPARAEVAQSATTSRPSTPGFTLTADADQAISSPVRVDVPAMPYRTSS